MLVCTSSAPSCACMRVSLCIICPFCRMYLVSLERPSRLLYPIWAILLSSHTSVTALTSLLGYAASQPKMPTGPHHSKWAGWIHGKLCVSLCREGLSDSHMQGGLCQSDTLATCSTTWDVTGGIPPPKTPWDWEWVPASLAAEISNRQASRVECNHRPSRATRIVD